MTLNEWIKAGDNSPAQFGTRMGVTGQAVRMWMSGEREPDALIRKKIIEKTEGAVTVQDMHDTRVAWLDERQEARSGKAATGTQKRAAAQ